MAGTWKLNAKQKCWRNTTFRLAPYGLVSLLSYAIQNQVPSSGTTHSELHPPHQVLIKSISHRLACRPTLGRHLLSYKFLFQHMSRFVSSWKKKFWERKSNDYSLKVGQLYQPSKAQSTLQKIQGDNVGSRGCRRGTAIMCLLDMMKQLHLELSAAVVKCTKPIPYRFNSIASRMGRGWVHEAYFAVQSCVGGDVIFFSDVALITCLYTSS